MFTPVTVTGTSNSIVTDKQSANNIKSLAIGVFEAGRWLLVSIVRMYDGKIEGTEVAEVDIKI
jgi:hypothetical protein